MTSLADPATVTTLEATEAIAALRFEIEQSAARLAAATADRDALLVRLRDADAFATASLQRHATWKEVWKKERADALKREKELEKMKTVLSEERKVLEERKRQHASDSARVDGSARTDHLQDVQAEHARRTERLTQEADKWREQCYDVRKKHEELAARHHQLQSQRGREQDIAAALETEMASLRALAEHVEGGDGNGTNSAASEQVARDMKLRLEEKDMQLESLQREATELRKGRDAAICAKDELVASHQAMQEKWTLEIAKAGSLRLSLERNLQATKKELSQALSSKTELEDQLKNAAKELGRVRETFGEAEEAHKEKEEQLRRAFQQSDSQLKKTLAATNTLLTEERAKTKELEGRCVETQDHAMKQMAALAQDLKVDDSADKLFTAQEQITCLENACQDLKNELNAAAQSHKTEVQRLQHACESCHRDLHLVLREKEEHERRSAAARAQRAEAEQKIRAAAEETARLSRQIADLTAEVGSLRETSASEDEVARCKEELSRERRRSAAYKGKALAAHERGLKAKGVLESLCGASKPA